MLMTEREACLNDAIRALREAAERHADGASRAAGDRLRALLDDLAQRRDDGAAALLAAWHDAPQAGRSPDPDAELVKSAVSRIKAAVAEEADGLLAEEAVTAETTALNALDQALHHDHPDDLAAALVDQRADLSHGMTGLQPFLPDDEGG